MQKIIGLDVGGANIKACLLTKGESADDNEGLSRYFEVWRQPGTLAAVLREISRELGLGEVKGKTPVALTMTAELCDVFTTKEEGVLFILDQVKDAFPLSTLYVWTTRGEFCDPGEIREEPLLAAAANWLASGTALARNPALSSKKALFADMGSTTTDLIPLASGQVVAQGKTDQERLQLGELVYTGVLRSFINGLINQFYIKGLPCQVANEYFAVTADVYRILSLIKDEDYNFTTPDGGSRDALGCAKRLSRTVSLGVEDLGWPGVIQMARFIQEKQINLITNSIYQIMSQGESANPEMLIYTGQGSFILEEVARRLCIKALSWRQVLAEAHPSQAITAYAVAWLLLEELAQKR